MIYQCYFKPGQEERLFSGPPYAGFGLEPEVNDALYSNCPELKDPYVRLQLTEYASFLWLWRNGGNPDHWTGSTSYRQFDKSRRIFRNKEEIETLLARNPVVGWCRFRMLASNRLPLSLSRHTEICHPGLNTYLADVLAKFGHPLPASWQTSSSGFFANYWVMSNEMFEDFMQFSWPMVEWSLSNIKHSDFYKNEPLIPELGNAKATGFFMERLFIIWYMLRNIEPLNAGIERNFLHNVPAE